MLLQPIHEDGRKQYLLSRCRGLRRLRAPELLNPATQSSLSCNTALGHRHFSLYSSSVRVGLAKESEAHQGSGVGCGPYLQYTSHWFGASFQEPSELGVRAILYSTLLYYGILLYYIMVY